MINILNMKSIIHGVPKSMVSQELLWCLPPLNKLGQANFAEQKNMVSQKKK